MIKTKIGKKGKDEFGGYTDFRSVRFYKKYGFNLLYGCLSRLKRVINSQSNKGIQNIKPGYFEFGVFNGRAAHTFANYIKVYQPDVNWDFNLFDSWQGLPHTTDDRDVHPEWEDGTYCSEGSEYVIRRLKTAGIEKTRINIVSGWFEDSLTKNLQQEIINRGVEPIFICIDCDYYSSTIVVLEWLRPLLKSGALLYFDDIWSYNGSPNKGELKAIIDFNTVDRSQGLTVMRNLDISERIYMFWRDDDLEPR